MAYVWVRPGKLREIAGGISVIKMAEVTGINERLIRAWLKGRRATIANVKKFSVKFGHGEDISDLILFDPPAPSKAIVPSAPIVSTPSTVLSQTAIDGVKPQDVKLLLSSAAIRDCILSGERCPTLAACVLDAVTFTPVDDRHKDHPFLPDCTYNHFFQPSVVVTLARKREPRILGYHRQEQIGTPGYVHTQGFAILFACDYVRNTHHEARSLMDEWSDQVRRKDTRAATRFVNTVLPSILQYKLNFIGYKSLTRPLGVITNDQRPDGVNRVYTQFVFHVELQVPQRNVDLFVSRLSGAGLLLRRLPDDLDPHSTFVGKKGRKNAMDILAWQALMSHEDTLTCENAMFRRGFEIL